MRACYSPYLNTYRKLSLSRDFKSIKIEKTKFSQEKYTPSCLTLKVSLVNMEGHDHSMPARGPMCNMNARSLLALLIQS